MIGTIAGCGDVGSDNATMGEPTEESTPIAKFKVGDTVNFEAFEVTIEAVQSGAQSAINT